MDRFDQVGEVISTTHKSHSEKTQHLCVLFRNHLTQYGLGTSCTYTLTGHVRITEHTFVSLKYYSSRTTFHSVCRFVKQLETALTTVSNIYGASGLILRGPPLTTTTTTTTTMTTHTVQQDVNRSINSILSTQDAHSGDIAGLQSVRKTSSSLVFRDRGIIVSESAHCTGKCMQ